MNATSSVPSSFRSQAAFTLIELLIALTIFTILSVISYRALASIFQTREQLNTESTKWRDLSLFFTRLDNDFANVLSREIRTADGRTAAPLCLNAYTPATNEATLAFTRTGFADVNNENGAPQRVGYRLTDGKLEWLWWSALDQAPRTSPSVYPALGNVAEAKWRALPPGSNNTNWQQDWPASPSNCARIEKGAAVFPAALELSLTLTTGETITRVFALRPAIAESAASGG
jgi:general secretion pathway protein J